MQIIFAKKCKSENSRSRRRFSCPDSIYIYILSFEKSPVTVSGEGDVYM